MSAKSVVAQRRTHESISVMLDKIRSLEVHTTIGVVLSYYNIIPVPTSHACLQYT